jgi:hypothetical protein
MFVPHVLEARSFSGMQHQVNGLCWFSAGDQCTLSLVAMLVSLPLCRPVHETFRIDWWNGKARKGERVRPTERGDLLWIDDRGAYLCAPAPTLAT